MADQPDAVREALKVLKSATESLPALTTHQRLVNMQVEAALKTLESQLPTDDEAVAKAVIGAVTAWVHDNTSGDIGEASWAMLDEAIRSALAKAKEQARG